jgi:hypothetical protein
MAEIVQSLFGVSPEMYQRQQQDRADAQALRFAQLDPFQQANFAIGRGANMLGGAIGGALGGQDPELQRVTMRQQIARQLNPGDPASIQQAIAALSQAGDAEGAMMLQGEYRKLQESGALIGQRTAAAQASLAQATREREPRAAPTTNELTNARAIAAAAGPEGSPEYNAAFNAEYQRLTAPKDAKGPAFGTDREAVAAEVYNKPFADLSPTERAVVNRRVEEEQGRKSEKTAPKIVLPSTVQETEFAKKRGGEQATALTQAATMAQSGSQALTTIQSMKQLDAQGQLFTGPLAGGYVSATNLLASVGLLSPAQTNRLTSSEVYDKQAKDLVMQDLGGKLGAQISDADRKFVEARIPQITTSAKARTELLNKLEEIQKGKVNYFNKMNEHANKFGNLNTFDFSQPYAPPKTGGWSIKPK